MWIRLQPGSSKSCLWNFSLYTFLPPSFPLEVLLLWFKEIWFISWMLLSVSIVARKQALLFGQPKRASRERASEGLRRSLARSRKTCFTRPNRRACSQAMSIAATSPSFVILQYYNNYCLIFYQRMSWRARLPREYPSFRWAGASCLSKLKFFFKPLKKICFQTEILGNFVLFFCLLLHRLAVLWFCTSYYCTDPGREILHHSTVCRCGLLDILNLSKLVNHNYNKIWLAINYPDFSTNSTV